MTPVLEAAMVLGYVTGLALGLTLLGSLLRELLG
jgi:hypothetical protein